LVDYLVGVGRPTHPTDRAATPPPTRPHSSLNPSLPAPTNKQQHPPPTTQPEEFVKSLAKPRKIVILVMAGKPVDATIDLLSQHMEVRGLSLSFVLFVLLCLGFFGFVACFFLVCWGT
jgi:hypothetical protein